MQFVLSDWTMVLAGAWNASIFAPPWVSANVFNGQNVSMEMQLGAVSPVLRYHFGNSTLIVQPDMIIGAAREITPDVSNEITAMLCTILEKLPHTPVSAIGINFGFREEHPDKALLNNFNIADNKKLIECGGEVIQTSIQREITLEGGLLRLRETIEPTGAVHFHLNFHYEIGDAATAAQVLQANGAQRHALALDLMNTVYGLKPE